MDTRFLRPNVIWGGVWVAILMLICSIGYWQTKLYWKSSFERVQKREFNMLHGVMPYALAFLEEHGQTGLLRQTLNPDEELFSLVYTDARGAIKYPEGSSGSAKVNLAYLKNYKFSYVYKIPQTSQESTPPPTVEANPGVAADPKSEDSAYGKLYILTKPLPSLRESLWDKDYFNKIWPGESFLGFTLIGYFLLMVGFAAICSITAKFQSHFQSALEEQHRSELETRDLRIQVLESYLKTLDLKLQILDQDHEKALTTSNKARKAIDRLVKRLQSESTKNEELEEKLTKAQFEHKSALQALRAIREDIESVTAERKKLETMRQAEQQEYPVPAEAYRSRPKEYLWLNLVYKNLAFSKRALQNIVEIQYVHDVFPSLPDALSVLNSSTVDSLTSGNGMPSRSVVRYTQTLDNFQGQLWEYRFSKDGRIFFGLSQSRTWSIDTILLKRHFTLNRYKYEKHLGNTLGKDNNDLKPGLSQ
jgi:hypothetical protein